MCTLRWYSLCDPWPLVQRSWPDVCDVTVGSWGCWLLESQLMERWQFRAWKGSLTQMVHCPDSCQREFSLGVLLRWFLSFILCLHSFVHWFQLLPSRQHIMWRISYSFKYLLCLKLNAFKEPTNVRLDRNRLPAKSCLYYIFLAAALGVCLPPKLPPISYLLFWKTLWRYDLSLAMTFDLTYRLPILLQRLWKQSKHQAFFEMFNYDWSC